MDREALISEMMTKGHERSTAEGAIAGRGMEDLWGEYMGGGGGGDRMVGSIDESQVSSVQDYIQGQFAGEDLALQALLDRMDKREDPLAMYGRLEEEAGLPQLRGAATTLTGEIENIEDVLRSIEPDVAAKTRESLMTEAQRRGTVQAGRKPFLEKITDLARSLGRITGRISTAESGLLNKVQLALKGQEMDLEPLQLYYATLVDRNARLLTGFTTDRQTKLDLLFDKLQRERTLSDQDWELANSLASEERGYTQQLQTAAAGAGVTLTGSESTSDLLRLVGEAAREEIEYERAQAGKATAGEISAGDMRDASNDAQGGMLLSDLQNKYAGKLSVSEIVEVYTSVSPHGEPTEAYAKDILGTETTTGSSTAKSDYDFYISQNLGVETARRLSGWQGF